MSAYLSSVPVVLKLNHAPRDSMGPFKHEDGNKKTYNIPLKQYQTNHTTPTLGDILRGADTITSITFDSSVLQKFSDSSRQDKLESHSTVSRDSPFVIKDTYYTIGEAPDKDSSSYTTLLTSSANARPSHIKSPESVTSQNQISEDSDNFTELMKLKGSKCKMKENSTKDSKNRIVNKKGRNKKRSKSALGRSKGSNVVDRLYQSPQVSGTKTPFGKQEVEIKPKQQTNDPRIHKNGLGIGAMQISLCKPITIHNNRPERREVKSEVPRTSNERVCTATSTKSLIQAKNVDIVKEAVILPQMTNNSMIKSTTQTEIVRKTNNFFSPLTQKLPMHVGSSVHKNQAHGDNTTKVTKIFLSDKHSGTVKDCGIEIPCAPPATPTPEQLRKVEYIPSLNDIRSQRAVKVKLQVLEKEAQKKLEKQREEKEKVDKQNKKIMEKDLKHQQRLEIYALNKVMTELENSRFKEFCIKKGIKTS